MSDAANWSRVRELFSRALDLDAPLRPGFLREACGVDAALHAEVSSLLAAHAEAGSLAEGSPFDALDASAFSSFLHGLRAGDQLGPYFIVGPLGAGGMGEVYEAHDTVLGRRVAIKILSAELALDGVARDRFDREAKVLAALNHPNIGAIHGIETPSASGASGRHPTALVLELIEGRTLAERVALAPLSIADALLVGAQIASALEAAHEKGIIHRDLKPANIKVTPAGVVKVLDFGLAKAIDRDPSADAVTSMVTGPGTVLGTPAYMSPEQVRGEGVDKRTDVWALGCVLFELLTGRRAFGGGTPSDCVAAVLEREPDWSALPQAVPESIRALLRRCLQKDRTKRLRDTGDARFALEDASLTPAPVANAQPGKRPSLILTLLGLTAAALAALAIAVAAWPRPAATTAPLSLTIPPPAGTSFLTVQQGGPPAVSPDGRAIAFVAQGPDGRHLWVRSLDDFDARRLAGTEGASYPGWSPDSRSLTFSDGNSLKRVELDGGGARVVSARTRLTGPASWSETNRILWSNGSELYVVDAAGGEPLAVTARNAELFEENHYSPTFLPDNRHYLFLVRGGLELQFDVCVGEIGSKERRVLLTGVTAARYTPSGGSGWLLYIRDGRLLAHPFDTNRMALSGEPRPVADRVAVHGFGIIGDFGVSAAGVLAYRVAEPTTHELAWFDRAGRNVGGIGDRPGNRRNNVRLSRDGKTVAFTRQTDGVQDVWTHDFARGVSSRLTFDGGRSPVWSPDGSEIAYLHQDTIIRKSVARGSVAAVWTGPGLLSLNDWSGDGRHLLITRWDSAAGMDGRGLWMISDVANNSASHEPALLEAGGLHGQFAPATGAPRWIAFDGSGQTFVRTMPGDGAGRWQVSVNGGNGVRWRPDGSALFFISNQSFMVVDVEDGPTFRTSTPRTLFGTPGALRTAMSQYALGYDVAPDGQQFLITSPQSESSASVIKVLINWQSVQRGK